MCGRFTLTSSPEELARRFGIDPPLDLAPRYNIAPGQGVLAVRARTPDAREGAMLHWGLVPPWAEGPEVGFRMINARSETAAEKPAFRDALRERRCLVPATGFYEWAPLGAGAKQPYHVTLRVPFGFAGLWERWQDPAGGVLESCTILTTDAAPCLRDIHGRMPVMLGEADFAHWLDPAVHDLERLRPLLAPVPDAALVFHPVSDRVNSARIDDAACMAPVAEAPRQPSLF